MNHIILDQNEIDKQHLYMKVNGIRKFSSEKTNMILFNNASGPKELPQYKLNSQKLLHKSEINSLEYILQQNLTGKDIWKQYYLRQGQALIR